MKVPTDEELIAGVRGALDDLTASWSCARTARRVRCAVPRGRPHHDPISAPTGEAWVLHPVLDDPGHHVPVDPAVVWWSTGNGRELVSVTGRGFSDAELAALLPALTFDGVAWAWPGATASGMAEVPAPHRDQWQQRSSATTLADGSRVAIVVTTGSRWDLLEQSSLYPLVTRPGCRGRAPRRDHGGRHGRPRQLPRLLGAGGRRDPPDGAPVRGPGRHPRRRRRERSPSAFSRRAGGTA